MGKLKHIENKMIAESVEPETILFPLILCQISIKCAQSKQNKTRMFVLTCVLILLCFLLKCLLKKLKLAHGIIFLYESFWLMKLEIILEK